MSYLGSPILPPCSCCCCCKVCPASPIPTPPHGTGFCPPHRINLLLQNVTSVACPACSCMCDEVADVAWMNGLEWELESVGGQCQQWRFKQCTDGYGNTVGLNYARRCHRHLEAGCPVLHTTYPNDCQSYRDELALAGLYQCYDLALSFHCPSKAERDACPDLPPGFLISGQICSFLDSCPWANIGCAAGGFSSYVGTSCARPGEAFWVAPTLVSLGCSGGVFGNQVWDFTTVSGFGGRLTAYRV